MKKIFLSALLLIAVSCLVAQNKNGMRMYYYYPDHNLYYNENTKEYLYHDTLTASWITSKILPPVYVINNKTLRNAVFYNGKDVWTDNAKHKKKYRKSTVMAANE